jgi:hypothetical protein
MREHDINKLDNFMGAWYLESSICDKLIDYHKSSPYKYQGITGEVYKPEEKESIDIIVQTNAGKHEVCRQPSKLRRVGFDFPYLLQII